MTRFQVQGYAIPWEKPATVYEPDDEIAAPNAISPPRPEGANVTLIFGDHETDGRAVYASTARRSLSFFADDYGLGFSAWLDDDFANHRAMRNALGSGSVTQCSVNLLNPRFTLDGEGRARLIHARIDHVALVTAGAYPDTGCWPADQPYRERAPWLLDMSFAYGKSILERGRAPAWSRSSSSPVTSASSHSPNGGRGAARPASPGRVPASVLAILNDAGMRSMWEQSQALYSELMRLDQRTRNHAMSAGR